MVIALQVGSTTPIYDHASLVSAVEDHLDRTDFAARISRFVQLVEAYLKRELRTLDMETSVELTAAASVALPSDLLSIRSLTVKGDAADYIPDRTLRTVSPSQAPAEFSGFEDQPYAFTRVGDTLLLSPPPPSGDNDPDITLSLIYLAQFVPLSPEAESNWIMASHPDIYFYGVLAHAYGWIPQPEEAATYASLFDGAVESLKSSRNRDRWGSGVAMPTGVVQTRGARC